MTTEGNPRPQGWKKLHDVAMLESDLTKSPPLLDAAINAVLDQIEEALTDNELQELNNALHGLRSRRTEVNGWMSGRVRSSDQPKAA